jgi:hypothetical protein
VVDGHRVLPEPSWRLHQQHQVAGAQGGQHQLAPRVEAAVDVQLARGRAPGRLDGVAQLGREAAVPAEVVGGGDADGGIGQLPVGQPFGVLAAGRDQGVDQGVAVGRLDAGERAVAGGGTEVVAALAQRPQEADRAGRGVEADGVADPGVLGRVRRQHHRHPPVGRGDVSQPGQGDRGAGHPFRPLGVGDVPRQAVAVELLERERHADQPAVELGDGHLGGRVQRAQAAAGGGPLGPRRGQAQRLDDGDVEGGDGAGVPGLVVAAGLRQRRGRPAGGEHRHHQRVGPAELLEQARVGGPEAGAPDRQGAGPAGLDGRAEDVDELGVAGQLVGPVVEDGDGRPAGRRPLAHPPRRGGPGGGEAVAGEQDRVGQEVGQLGQVGRAAVGQVPVGLGGDAGGDAGQRHQGRVGRLLAAEDDQRPRLAAQPVQSLAPGLLAAEQADDDQVGAVQQGRQVLQGQPGRVGQPVAGPAGPGREQVGVGGRQQQDAGTTVVRHGASSGSSPRVVGHAGRSLLAPGSSRAPVFPPVRAVTAVGSAPR